MTGSFIMRRAEVGRVFAVSRSMIYDAIGRGEFPKSVRIGRRAVG